MLSAKLSTKSAHLVPKQCIQNEEGKVPDTSLGCNNAIPVQVHQQNTGLIIRSIGDGAVFEIFELSPKNGSVFKTRGRLVRDFPATAVQVERDVLKEPDFQSSIANTMATMSHQKVSQTVPKTRKAGQSHEEERDTTSPAAVTELLASILLGFGREVAVQSIRKHTREEVHWHSSKLPWRRSPTWLLIRVSLQLSFHQGGHLAKDTYKKFMVYFLAHILELARERSAESEILHTMSAKIIRRLSKLRHSQSGVWIDPIRRTMEHTSRLIRERWLSIRQICEAPIELSGLSRLDPDRDMHLHLPDLDKFLSSVPLRRDVSTNGHLVPKLRVPDLSQSTLPRLPHDVTHEYKPLVLAAIERWVAVNIGSWIQDHASEVQTCELLGELLFEYHKDARMCYEHCPEGTSRMLLTLLEIWIAMDKSALKHIPLMRKYSPHIPIELLKGLLLAHEQDMDRLYQAEEYLLHREATAEERNMPSIFSSFGTRDCFSCQYFDESTSLLEVLCNIKETAEREKQLKKEELHRLQNEYNDWMSLYERSSCEYDHGTNRYGDTVTYHRPGCAHCGYRDSARRLSIVVHEWPLPSDQFEAKSTVFELDPPTTFQAWREGTIYFIDDILGYHSPKHCPNHRYTLSNYDGLSRWHKAPTQRVCLLSEAKPHLNTHRRDKLIVNLEEDEVCVNNGLQLQYFDATRDTFLSYFCQSDAIFEQCTVKLPSRTAGLTSFILRTHDCPDGKTPNETLAEQHLCPDHLSILEGKALMSLSYGHEIRWLMLLTQLESPSVDFGKPETTTFLLQICLQSGPNNIRKTCRDSHAVLTEDRFARALSKALGNRISHIEKNPETYFALWGFLVLAQRGLTMNWNLRSDFLEILARCRQISYRWAEQLYDKSLKSDEQQRIQFRDMMFNIALVCMDSYNVDPVHLESVVDCPEAMSILIEMSIRIRDNIGLRTTQQQDHLQTFLFKRWQILMHRSSPLILKRTIHHENRGADMAIKRCWPGYNRDATWNSVPSAEYWVETSSSSIQVLYNTLLGELLVGGLPVSRLPESYQTNPRYEPLFGRSALDVRPSEVLGMSFISQGLFCEHEVHFGMQCIDDCRGSEELLLHTKHRGSTHDLVPSRVLAGSIPEMLARDFVHWYHHKTGEIEFRRRSDPWATDSSGWRLKKQHCGKWFLARGPHRMMSPHSETAGHIAAILGPLESIMHIHMLYNSQERQIDLQLPRLKLEFYLQSKHDGWQTIRSRQFQGMQVDEDQSTGTLVGLRSKLVLKASANTGKRLILIPEGLVSVTKSSSGHVDVSVANGTASRVQIYGIDSHLCRTTDNGTLQTKLFLCYLHALTSYCVPDPFTMHTGTELAISILESAAVRSWITLTEENVNLLTQIASLSPVREFDPKHLQEMQTVKWHGELSFLSQPGRFFILTREIIERVQQLQFLTPNSNAPKEIDHTNLFLVQRDAIRSASLYVSGSAAAAFTIDHDQDYISRDRGQRSERALKATRIVMKISNRSCSLETSPDPQILEKLYELLGVSSGTLPPRRDLGLDEILYDSKWLADPEGNLPALWCRLHYVLGHSAATSRYRIATWLASLAYAKSKYDTWDVTQILYAFANIPDVREISLPAVNEYDLAQGYQAVRPMLTDLAKNESIDYHESPEWNLPQRVSESGYEWHKRREREFSAQLADALEGFTGQLVSQWPCPQPRSPTGSLEHKYINVQGAMTAVSKQWRTWYQNLEFRHYLQGIVSAMNDAEVCPTSIPGSQPPANPPPQQQQQAFVTAEDILNYNNQPPATIPRPNLEDTLLRPASEDTANGHDLQGILDNLGAKCRSKYQRGYLADLKSSNSSLNDQEHGYILDKPLSDLRSLLQQHSTECRSHTNSLYKSMVKDTSPEVLSSASDQTTSSVLLEMARIGHRSSFWPRTPPSFFLGQLRKVRWSQLPDVWKQRVVEYGLAITEMQRADRLVGLCDNEADLAKELRNVGHENWSPFAYPEWLLMECESGLLIRKVQQDIAQLMMAPPEAQNATMQLNMGEGKSSVIVPTVAAALGDGSQLVRVIVTKPQFKQMHQTLVSKLAGMIGRQIYQLPISRDVLPGLDASAVNTIQNMVVECETNGGVLLVQPEQLLSFQLMGLESQINMRNEIAPKLLDIQAWLDDNSRDIIDESDEVFSVKFELVYTMGQQRPIEHSPARWQLVQQVMDLVKELACEIHCELPKSLEVFNWNGEPGRFPRIRILDEAGKDRLLDRLAERICCQGLSGFAITHQGRKQRTAIRKYISESCLAEDEINAVEGSSFWHDSVINALLTLRGLFAQGIIPFCLGQKRWKVNYGVDPNRDSRLAVPFRAKDDPSPRAEFSHPDVAILLTCLSYYCSGLDYQELLDSFDRLKQDDQAQPEYHRWKASAPSLPPEFHDLVGVNLRDKVQFEAEIFPHLRYSKGAIDYFLSKVVFAREMKEFPHKLSTSGWDLGKPKKHPATGFSGTNDSRYILPSTVTQLDQDEQRHTNALVLRYLLQRENEVLLMPNQPTLEDNVSGGKVFLGTVSSLFPQIRVVLDVGAQITDLTNREVAGAWLEVTRQHSAAMQAVIFFDEGDVMSVLDRSGNSEPFQTSHFSQQTDKCLVFLDEAHTRGTDLKLPNNYCAAVTLGAKLTKDKLLQGMYSDKTPLPRFLVVLLTFHAACMRMRKLGHGQSIIFCVPEEIEHKILKMKEGSSQPSSSVTVPDILEWAISETMDDTTRCIPLWATQGLRFRRNSKLWLQGYDQSVTRDSGWAKSFLEDEAQSLEQRYRPGSNRNNLLETDDKLDESFRRKLSDHKLDVDGLNEADLQEEQERELSPEAEEERQIERPPPAEPMRHMIHPNVRKLIHDGFLHLTDGFRPAFSTLNTTSAANFLPVDQFPQSLLVTDDFARTVRLNFDDGDQSDFFQRSVAWILTSTMIPWKSVILSAYEVQKLLPEVKASPYVTLHLYAPRASMNQQPLDHLALYTVPERDFTPLPPDTTSLLNLFAGQLYMKSYTEYTIMCDMLGLAWERVGDDEIESDFEIEADGFIPHGSTTGTLINKTQFTRSPSKFLQVFLTNARRNNESIEKTHMGILLSGQPLSPAEFEVSRAEQDHTDAGMLLSAWRRLRV